MSFYTTWFMDTNALAMGREPGNDMGAIKSSLNGQEAAHIIQPLKIKFTWDLPHDADTEEVDE